MRNIERGVEVPKYQNQLKDLQALELSAIAQIEKEAQASSGSLGTPEVTSSLTGAINRDVVQKVTSNIKGEIVQFSGEQIFNIDYEGNEKLAIDGSLRILSTLPSSLRVYNPSKGTRGAIQTLGPKNAYASGYFQKLILPTNEAINVAKRRAEENPEDIIDLTQFGDLYSDPLNPATKAKIIEAIGYTTTDVNLKVAKYIKNGKTIINPVGEFTRQRTDKNPNGFFVYKPLSLQDYQKFVGVNY